MASQISWWCRCGEAAWRGGLCPRCHRRARLSRERFGGQREAILARDGEACVLCAGNDIVVHHRAERRFVTLCRGHHASIHHRRRLWFDAPALYAALWREQHRRQPEQLDLPLIAPPTVEQILLFASAA